MTLALYLLPERDCHSCTPDNKKKWGCNEDTILPIMIDDEQLYRCPRRPFLDNSLWYNAIFMSSSYHDKGMLTEPGTWLDQPAKLTASLEVIRQASEDAQDYRKTAEERRRQAQAAASASAPPPRRV